MSQMSTTRETWRPTAGSKARWVDGILVTVVRVYADTATIQYWGRGCLAGKRVTARGVSLRNLRPDTGCGECDACQEALLDEGSAPPCKARVRLAEGKA